jgi:exodeoxyribonuclease V alpha subunit
MAVGAPGDFCPLILDGHRLYLHRYWRYEQELAQSILERCSQPPLFPDHDPAIAAALAQIFPDTASDQAKAARVATMNRFSIISGGPGTGKTYTVAKIILLLQALCPERALNIFLAAPTGKAAARLQAAVDDLLKNDRQQRVTPALQSAQTLHRLLGYSPATAKFHYHAEHPLPADAIIVDEASMIDLVLMRQLIRSVHAHSRLILVGDKDQLASVEAGAVLGDMCHGIGLSAAMHHPDSADQEVKKDATRRPLRSHIAVLERSYRFDAQSGIGALSRAINAGDSQKVLSLLGDPHTPAIEFRPLADWASSAKRREDEIMAAIGPLFDCLDPSAAFDHLNRFKILCAVRKGPYGVEAMNRWIEQIMRRGGRIPPSSGFQSDWYTGRPVMVTRNDYFHGLFNGDLGIAMQSAGGTYDGLQVVFPGSDGGFKALMPQQLPDHQTVYAMTIHKSQGSEFERVMIVLPEDNNRLLTRELIYTAVTRARRSIVIWAHPDVLARAVERPIRRASGLREMLWNDE